MRALEPSPAHSAYFEELKGTLANTGADIPAEELLAIAAQFVGTLIAMQDFRSMTSARALEIVSINLEAGNRNAIATVFAGRA